MTKAFEAMLAWATGRRVIQCFLVFGVVGFPLFRLGPYAELQSLAGPLPEEAVTGPSGLYDFLEELGVDGRGLYGTFQLLDLLNPLLMGLVGVALVGWLVGRSGLVRGRALAISVPFVAPAADVLENVVLLAAIAKYPAHTWIATILPVVTSVKFQGVAATLLLSLALTAVALYRRQKRLAKPNTK